MSIKTWLDKEYYVPVDAFRSSTGRWITTYAWRDNRWILKQTLVQYAQFLVVLAVVIMAFIGALDLLARHS
jgi:hypothetical protein